MSNSIGKSKAMQSSKELKVAIVSDLHAYNEDKGPSPPSNLWVQDANNDPGRHPIIGLQDLIERENIHVDLLLCGGDMGDKANPAGILYVWEKLNLIKIKLKAKRLAATTGNH